VEALARLDCEAGPSHDVNIEDGDQLVEIATGNGKAFAIRYRDTTSARARFDEFVAIINASAKDAKRDVMDFHQL
jgi:hypothetical protein